MQQIWTIFNYISHTCERSAIEKDDRGNIQEIFIDTYSFLLVKAHRNHNKFLTKMLTSFLHSEITQDT